MKDLVFCTTLCASLFTSAIVHAQTNDHPLFVCSKIATSALLSHVEDSDSLRLEINAIHPQDFNFVESGYSDAYRLVIDFNDAQCHFTELDNAKIFACKSDDSLHGIIVGGAKVAVKSVYVSTEIVRRTYQVYDEGTYHDSDTRLSVSFVDGAGHHIHGTVNFGMLCNTSK